MSFVPYSEREDWKDVQPIEQNDGPNAPATIASPPNCFIFVFFYPHTF